MQTRIATLSAALSPDGRPQAVDSSALLPPIRPRTETKPWYRSLGCLIVLLLFFPPAWALLLLTDPEQRKAVKLIACGASGLHGRHPGESGRPSRLVHR